MASKARPERVTPVGTAVQSSNLVSAPVPGMEDVQPPVEILIVDDRPENLLALEAILEPLGQIIVRASSGDEALRKLLSHNVAMILLDVQMPGINGFETAKMIKSRERTRYIPIIFLTAISKDETYVFEGYSVGAVDYMSKPFQPDILRSKVNVFVDLFQKQRQLAEQQEMIAEAERRNLETRHMREIYESEARYSEIVGSAMDAIIGFDADGTITLFNGAAERMFGMPASAALHGGMQTFLPEALEEEMLDRACTRATEVRTSEEARTEPGSEGVLSLTGQRASGERFPVEATASCVELDGKKTYTLIVRDIAERKRAELALQTQATSLAKAMTELKALNDELAERQ